MRTWPLEMTVSAHTHDTDGGAYRRCKRTTTRELEGSETSDERECQAVRAWRGEPGSKFACGSKGTHA